MNKYEVVVERVTIFTQRVMVDAYCLAEAQKKAITMEACGGLDPTWNTSEPKVKISFTVKKV